MGLYIHGLKLPEGDGDADITITVKKDGTAIATAWYEPAEVATNHKVTEISQPHRRLIEEPAVLCYGGLDKISPYDFVGTAKYFSDQITNRKTVIEAEGEYMEKKVTGEIKSELGFYIGDICYVLSRSVYDRVFLGSADMEGVMVVDEKNSFAVSHTRWGDGTYADQRGNTYSVDAGVIGLVPLELCKEDGIYNGLFVKTPGIAEFEAQSGIFDITLPGEDQIIHIDTTRWADEEEEDYEEED